MVGDAGRGATGRGVGGEELWSVVGGESWRRLTVMLSGVAGVLLVSVSGTGDSGRSVGSVTVDSVTGHDSSEPRRLEGAAPMMI